MIDISNLSQETIKKLVLLSIEKQPYESSLILLNNVKETTPDRSEIDKWVNFQIEFYEKELSIVMQHLANDNFPDAVRAFRHISRVSLRQGVDTLRVFNGQRELIIEEPTISESWLEVLNKFSVKNK